MRAGDPRHRVKVGDLVSHHTYPTTKNDLTTRVTEIGLVVSWSPRRNVANVILGSGMHQVHVRKLKVVK